MNLDIINEIEQQPKEDNTHRKQKALTKQIYRRSPLVTKLTGSEDEEHQKKGVQK